MRISYDPAKRERTLRDRGLDFEDVPKIFDGVILQNIDDRFDYGEQRLITVGYLDARMIVVVWTPRNGQRHIISMRKANAREQKRYERQFKRS